MFIRNISIIISLITGCVLNAQTKWILKSEFLSKPDTVLVYQPKAYDAAKKYPLVYLLHGYSEDYKQWSQTTDLQRLSDQYNMVIICPDGFVSWYLNSPYQKGSRMEDFFFRELVPKVHNTFSIDQKNIFISGLSMGGYGSLRYFLLHQDYFNTAASTSGALTVDFKIFRNASFSFFNNARIIDDLLPLLGPKEQWAQYSISTLLKSYHNGKPFLLDCGTEDILYPSTVEIKTLANAMKIPITFISQPGNHNTDYWKKSLEYHFIFFKEHLK